MSASTQRPGKPGLSGGSFLPEEYVRDRRERRMNFFAVVSFGSMMVLIISTFLVTQRQWASVKAQQQAINAEYVTESAKIEQLKELEKQKVEMLDKAQVTAALLERVPRSVLLAELINRMPAELTLTEFALDGKRIVPEPPKPDPKEAAKTRGKGRPPAKGAPGKDGEKNEEKPKPTAPRYEFKIELVGLAATDEAVADYHAALKDCPLLENVDLISSVETVVDAVARRKFKMEAALRANVDARNIEPLQVPRDLARRAGEPGGWIRRDGLIHGSGGSGVSTTTATVDESSLDPTLPREEP